MGYTGGTGSWLGGFIGSLLIFFVKLLMIVLVIVFIAGIIIWIKNSFLKDRNVKESINEGAKKIAQSQVVQTISNDPVLKMVSVVLLAIIGVVLLFSLFNGFNSGGMGYGMNGYMNGMDMHGFSGWGGNIGLGQNTSYGLLMLLMLLARLLLWILIISLILAALVYVKKQYESGKLSFGKSRGQNPGQTPATIDVQPTNNQ